MNFKINVKIKLIEATCLFLRFSDIYKVKT